MHASCQQRRGRPRREKIEARPFERRLRTELRRQGHGNLMLPMRRRQQSRVKPLVRSRLRGARQAEGGHARRRDGGKGAAPWLGALVELRETGRGLRLSRTADRCLGQSKRLDGLGSRIRLRVLDRFAGADAREAVQPGRQLGRSNAWLNCLGRRRVLGGTMEGREAMGGAVSAQGSL